MDGFRNYDAWKLRTPEEDAGYIDHEVFESECGKYYSCDEITLRKFENEVDKVMDNPDYDAEDLADEIENLADEFGLADSNEEAIINYMEYLQDQKEAAEEAKAEWKAERLKGY